MSYVAQYTGNLTRFWWIPLLTGLISIGLGVWVFCCPAASLAALAYVFAIALLAAGVLNIGYSLAVAAVMPNWGWALVLGILEIIAGVWMFTLQPAVLASAFVIFVGVWMLVAAVNSIGEACMLASISVAWAVWMVLLLIATVAFAVIFLCNPVVGGAIVWLWIGVAFVTFGIFRICLAFLIKR